MTHTSKSRSTVMVAVLMAALAIALMLAAVGCGGSDGIVGKWEDANGTVMEFTEDGIFLASGTEGPEATYVDEDGTITVTVMGTEILTFGYEIVGDKLTITDPASGEAQEFTRM